MGKFFIDHKKTCDFLLVINFFNFLISHWVEILFLTDHHSVKSGEQISFLSLAAFFYLTFLLTINLDNISFKM
jgi:hypothetical protein